MSVSALVFSDTGVSVVKVSFKFFSVSDNY
jgi:hypothetical protein